MTDKITKSGLRHAVSSAYNEGRKSIEKRVDNLGTGRITRGQVKFTAEDALKDAFDKLEDKLDM